jgi:thiamine biosynthesis lipoprotein
MGTIAHIIAIAPNRHTANKSIEAAFEQLRNIETLMSYHRDDSEISIVNRDAFKQPVKVSQLTFEVIQKSVEFSKLSEGAFDITVGPLVDLWKSAGESNSVPAQAQLDEACSKVGYEKLILDANEKTIQFAAEGMRIDLGGIAKGYAVDKTVETMINCGATGGMVDVGGNIRCFGTPPKEKTNWLIGLQDPNEAGSDSDILAQAGIQTGEPLLILQLNNAAVATSGGYRRFVVIDRQKYSHIINPQTGISAENLSSVTIISKNAMDADALSTAVSVLGAEKGLALIKTIPQTEAILIPGQPKHELIKTSGAEKYITSK